MLESYGCPLGDTDEIFVLTVSDLVIRLTVRWFEQFRVPGIFGRVMKTKLSISLGNTSFFIDSEIPKQVASEALHSREHLC